MKNFFKELLGFPEKSSGCTNEDPMTAKKKSMNVMIKMISKINNYYFISWILPLVLDARSMKIKLLNTQNF